MACRFPPPLTFEEQAACFVVRDHSGQARAYIYFEDEPGRRSAAKLLSKDEARRIAANIAKLPALAQNTTNPNCCHKLRAIFCCHQVHRCLSELRVATIYPWNLTAIRPLTICAIKLLTRDEPRRIAANIAKLPGLPAKT